MFKNIGKIGNLVAEAHKMKQRMTDLRKELDKKVVTISVGGGAVEVTVSGKMEVLSMRIADSLLQSGDTRKLQDLLVKAVNEGLGKIQKQVSESMSEITGGMNLPGLGF